MEKYQCMIAITGLICVTALQITAWALGYNGTVFALTSSVIGGITGFALGIKINIKKSVGEYVNGN